MFKLLLLSCRNVVDGTRHQRKQVNSLNRLCKTFKSFIAQISSQMTFKTVRRWNVVLLKKQDRALCLSSRQIKVDLAPMTDEMFTELVNRRNKLAVNDNLGCSTKSNHSGLESHRTRRRELVVSRDSEEIDKLLTMTKFANSDGFSSRKLIFKAKDKYRICYGKSFPSINDEKSLTKRSRNCHLSIKSLFQSWIDNCSLETIDDRLFNSINPDCLTRS